jgi:Ca2+/H+ antiporter
VRVLGYFYCVSKFGEIIGGILLHFGKFAILQQIFYHLRFTVALSIRFTLKIVLFYRLYAIILPFSLALKISEGTRAYTSAPALLPCLLTLLFSFVSGLRFKSHDYHQTAQLQTDIEAEATQDLEHSRFPPSKKGC